MWPLLKMGVNPQPSGLKTAKKSPVDGLHTPKDLWWEEMILVGQINMWNEASFQSLHTLNLLHLSLKRC